MRACSRARPHHWRGRSARTAFARGTASASCPWRAGTARPTGEPSELTERRWRHFGSSGAKLIWGGEAVAVRARRPRQPEPARDRRARRWRPSARLREHARRGARRALRRAPRTTSCVGLQLTHSGRFARPTRRTGPSRWSPTRTPCSTAASRTDVRVLSDDELDRLVDDFVRAARLAAGVGLRLRGRQALPRLPGPRAAERPRTARAATAASFENRTRFLRDVVEGIRAEAPGLRIGVRLSVFDTVPYRKDAAGRRRARGRGRRRTAHAFGLLDDGDLRRGARRQRASCCACSRAWACAGCALTAGSPYYNPHVQRPALFPPSDGYLPPEDPLRGVARQIEATARAQGRVPRPGRSSARPTATCRSGCRTSASARVREGRADFVGLGRMVLSYPELPADVLAGRPLAAQAHLPHVQRLHDRPAQRASSPGCYPLDPLLRRAPRRRAAARRSRPRCAHERHRRRRPPRTRSTARRSRVVTAFLALFSIVGFALYGLPFFYDFFVAGPRLDAPAGHLGQRATASSLVGPLFGFMAGMIVDRFGPRRLMLVGIVMAGGALVGLGGIDHARRPSTSSTC